MKYQIIGKNIPVTDAISSTIKKKMSKMDKFFLINDEVECRAVISVHGQTQKIEITIFLPMVPLRAEVENEDLYAAIDLAVDKLVGQMHKLKTRMDRNSGRESFARNV
ncbi:MAG: ribosome-associated translation inhibitor RaiA, partial [Erysipelotrichia bacterium]|nr:ribosome-associated translation inhibitor RaiA [Erysipelotrichia bacterium]